MRVSRLHHWSSRLTRTAGTRRLAVTLSTAVCLAAVTAAGGIAAASGVPAGISAAAAGTAAQSAGNPAPQLWPKLAPFKTATVADFTSSTSDELLAATTLEGAYNQRQGPNRVYIVRNPDDQTWLNDHVLEGVSSSALQGQGSGAAGQLDALLADYGHDIKGAILTNPSDPDTENLATTMAGIDDAMVAKPSQLPLLQQYGIPVIYSFANTTFASPQAAYQWGFTHLLPKTNPADLVMLSPGFTGELRDYIIATKSFVFWLTSTNSAEKPVMDQIISARPANTPIMGYIPNEGPDVADLSSLGHFLNASDFLDNESDWAAMPSPASLAQPQPQPVQASNNTVYVAFVVSEGDNAQYDQHRMFDVWTDGTDLGAVPEGWTTAPGMVDYAPSMLSWFYRNLPRNSELLPGPTGVGYATQMSGSNLQRFAQLSGDFMRKDSMSTVDFWANPSQIAAYAKASGVPSISLDGPLASYLRDGSTAVIGQTSTYLDPASTVLSSIEQDVLAGQNGVPDFLEPLVDGWGLDPQDVLAIGQALASWGKTVGKNFVFTTPSELALTEKAYQQGSGSSLPQLNAQAVSGASLLKLPSAGQVQGYTQTTASGPNLVANPSGQDGTIGWTDSAGTLSAGTYHGGPDITWSVPASGPGNPGANQCVTWAPSQQCARISPAVTIGDTYQFSVQVAGSGQVFMDIDNGAQDVQSRAINLKSGYQTLTWTATIPSNAGRAPQLEVRETGLGPVTVHIKNAATQLASTSS